MRKTVITIRFSSLDCMCTDFARLLFYSEQRVTTIIAHILIGLSIFLAPVQRVSRFKYFKKICVYPEFIVILQLVPTAVLLGVFLYMGVSCLTEQQVT